MAETSPPRGRSMAGTGCLLLFAIPFALVGVFLAATLSYALFEHSLMRSWVETPARLTQVDLHIEYDEGATYKTTAEYDYEFGGVQYHGTRVGLYSIHDNIGNFQRRVHQELESYKSSGRMFPCYVNPANPAQSILYRDLRWEMIAFFDLFILTFGGTGWGLLLGGVFASRHLRCRAALAASHPGEPWLWQFDWERNEVEPTDKHLPSVLVATAIAWNLVTLPLWWLLPAQIVNGNIWALVAAILPMVGVMLTWMTLRRFWLRWKFGRCILRLTKNPGRIGGELVGTIEVARPIDADTVDLMLRCESKITEGEDTKTVEIWSGKQTVANDSSSWDRPGSSIPIQFAIPAECLPASESDKKTIQWRLSATSGRHFKTEFVVPVFATGSCATS